jgi:glycosyltransferase involved in cell wall biosynthesis
MNGSHRKHVIELAIAVVVVGTMTVALAWLGWAWYESRLPATYSVMDYAIPDDGGKPLPEPMSGHAMPGMSHDTSIAQLHGPAGTPQRRFTLTAEQGPVKLASGRVVQALSFDGTPARSNWEARAPFRFLAVGEPHFRKGFHLLLDGYLRAFPRVGLAELTLKVSAACEWRAPRADITLVRERLSPDALANLYDTHDALVSASLGEGLGLPIAEAAAARLPVVTNLWGGHRDIVTEGDCWEIGHEEVPQLFCSTPDYFAAGQRCAYSAPDRIADALLAVLNATPAEREARARRAWMTLRERHGVAAAATRIQMTKFLPG